MSLVSEVIASFTPQVIFGMIGGFVGGIYGINKKGYDVKVSLILIFTAIVAGSAISEVLQKKFGLNYLLPLCLIAIPAGAFSGYLMVALDIVSPKFAAQVADKIGEKAVENIDK